MTNKNNEMVLYGSKLAQTTRPRVFPTLDQVLTVHWIVLELFNRLLWFHRGVMG